jgi:threonyl-tRNA synthetase
VAVASITENQADYAQTVVKMLRDQGIRAEADLRNDKISYKIRELSLQKVPFIAVVGEKEKNAGQVALRARRRDESAPEAQMFSVEDLGRFIAEQVSTRA